MKFLRLSIIVALCCSLNTFAATNTTLTITKATSLTADDAAKFQKAYGKSFSDKTGFSFKCNKKNCIIISTKAGFSGSPAKTLLNGRKSVKFSSADENFQLNCGKTDVSFCNVIQKSAVLK